MIDYSYFYDCLRQSDLAPWLETLPQQVYQQIHNANNGNLPRWLNALEQLPSIEPSSLQLDQDIVAIGCAEDCDSNTRLQLEQSLRSLIPWRKGPFNVFGIHIDTEWHSDWKWNRIKDHIQPLAGKTVLDVGCGSGYHCWRMLGAGAELVVGIDPSLLFVCQYHALRHYTGNLPMAVLPFKSEQLPMDLPEYDTVFSMGILYHRRSPFDHLLELKNNLKPGGELVLETLVIEGDKGHVLVPEGRYGKMGNVWFIPSAAELENWLRKSGFSDIRLADSNQTSTEEQRATQWMLFESLADFLDPTDAQKTIEGYPAPRRAVILATK